jgi:hypothetical protein
VAGGTANAMRTGIPFNGVNKKYLHKNIILRGIYGQTGIACRAVAVGEPGDGSGILFTGRAL